MIFSGAVIGALLALGYGDYHNEHVNVWTGGWVFHGGGFLLLGIAGALIGAIVGGTIGHSREHRSWWR